MRHYGVNELHLYTIDIQLVTRFICMHQRGGAEKNLSLLPGEENRKKKIIVSKWNFSRPPPFAIENENENENFADNLLSLDPIQFLPFSLPRAEKIKLIISREESVSNDHICNKQLLLSSFNVKGYNYSDGLHASFLSSPFPFLLHTCVNIWRREG